MQPSNLAANGGATTGSPQAFMPLASNEPTSTPSNGATPTVAGAIRTNSPGPAGGVRSNSPVSPNGNNNNPSESRRRSRSRSGSETPGDQQPQNPSSSLSSPQLPATAASPNLASTNMSGSALLPPIYPISPAVAATTSAMAAVAGPNPAVGSRLGSPASGNRPPLSPHPAVQPQQPLLAPATIHSVGFSLAPSTSQIGDPTAASGLTGSAVSSPSASVASLTSALSSSVRNNKDVAAASSGDKKENQKEGADPLTATKTSAKPPIQRRKGRPRSVSPFARRSSPDIWEANATYIINKVSPGPKYDTAHALDFLSKLPPASRFSTTPRPDLWHPFKQSLMTPSPNKYTPELSVPNVRGGRFPHTSHENYVRDLTSLSQSPGPKYFPQLGRSGPNCTIGRSGGHNLDEFLKRSYDYTGISDRFFGDITDIAKAMDAMLPRNPVPRIAGARKHTSRKDKQWSRVPAPGSYNPKISGAISNAGARISTSVIERTLGGNIMNGNRERTRTAAGRVTIRVPSPLPESPKRSVLYKVRLPSRNRPA